MLLVVMQTPSATPTLFEAVATATGLALVDVRQRLAGSGPWVLMVAADAEPLHLCVPPLSQLGLRALVCDPALVPDDDDRILVRQLALLPTHFQILDVNGKASECAHNAVKLLQVGRRTHTKVETTQTTQRRFSPAKALLTGGLSLTTKHTTRETRATQTDERFLLLARNDHEPDLMLYERRMDYRFLGGEIQPSSFANLERVATLVRQATKAPIDERLNLPGFIARLPKVGPDPADLALHLVQLARMYE
jgi:hypothetical protein